MRLDHLLRGVDVLESRGDTAAVEVCAVTHDSRAVRPGALYCCIPGATTDGHDHAPSAVAGGATALLCERTLDLDIAQVRVAGARAAMAPVAAAFHGHPSHHLAVAGVTGTNGKTTTTHLLAAVLEASGRPTGIVGTLGQQRTTPEAPELQALLAGFVDDGRAAVAMEVSSHALVQHRVDATRFAVVAFLNLTQDHLDYHGDMESYFAAKARLLTPAFAPVGVVNADDPWGARLLERPEIELRPFSLDEAADLVGEPTASTFTWRGRRVRLPLGGRFNVANALAAAAMAGCLDLSDDVVVEGLSTVGPVPGRFEPVDAGQAFAVVVDYAHTPDGLAQVLGAARQSVDAGGRVLVVFGCGGDRDRAKRPVMGRLAAELADVAVLTSDNPRSEDPLAIIAAVVAGAAEPGALMVEPDRAAAIALALALARAGDIVVIAGKGHEQGQTAAGVTAAFDDRVVARAALEASR